MSLLSYTPTREDRLLMRERVDERKQEEQHLARREREITETANLQKQLVRDEAYLEELLDDEEADASSTEDLELWISDLERELSEVQDQD